MKISTVIKENVLFVSPKQSLCLSSRSCRCYLLNNFYLFIILLLLDLWLVFGQHMNHEVLTHPEVVWTPPWKYWACGQNTDLQSESSMCDSLYTAVEMARDLRDCKKSSIKTGTSTCCESVVLKVIFTHKACCCLTPSTYLIMMVIWLHSCGRVWVRDRACVPMDTVHPCVHISHCCNLSTLLLRNISI